MAGHNNRYFFGLHQASNEFSEINVVSKWHFKLSIINEILLLMQQLNGAHMNCEMSGFGTMAGCAAEELCAKLIAGASLPPYATNFTVTRYDDMQFLQKLHAANKGIL